MHHNKNTFNIKVLATLFFMLFSFSMSYSQVGDVKESSKNDTRENRSSDRYSGSSSNVFFIFELINFVPVMIQAHKDMLDRKQDEPWLVSLDLGLNAGYYSSESTSVLLPSIRGNWGLFSSQVRWNRMQDLTGSFKTIDWQVIQFNLVATPKANFRFGTGVSYIKETNVTVNEHFLGLELHFKDRSINPLMEVRWSQNYDTGSTPRFEMNIASDYRIGTFGNFDVNIMGGFLYQRYYSETNFYFVQTGINIHFY